MRKFTCAFLLVSYMTVGTFGIASARSDYLEEFNDKYGTRYTSLDSCSTCHEVIPRLNPYGEDFRDNGFSFDDIEQMDSDGDGFTNITEIVDRTFPGDQVNVLPSGDEDTGCFIATAASGSPLEPYLTRISQGSLKSLSILVITSLSFLRINSVKQSRLWVSFFRQRTGKPAMHAL